jgi:acetylornithine deacetylase/succinyl-diaminopimelate desuccinylase-like protein
MPNDLLEQVLARAREGRDQAEAHLFALLAIPSVSALPEHYADCRRAAYWLSERLNELGMLVVVDGLRTNRQAVLMAEWMGRPGAPTLTIYGHYDVQPADPLDQWLTPPFTPTVQDGYVFARGADDNKGQIMASVVAAQRWFACGGPPLNLRFLVEGEEEIAGRSLPEYVRANAGRLTTDHLLVADGQFYAPGMPALVTALRGLLYTEIEVVGPAVDLHSGIYGGVAPNPFNSLAQILAGLRDREGRVHIPGFYDGIVPPTEEELASWRALPGTDDELRQMLGVTELDGEPGYTSLERRWARPTLDVHGIMGGFTGTGPKTVIPARATAKVSMRLVPGQRPEKVLDSLRELVAQLATPGTHTEVRELGSSPAVQMSADNSGAAALKRAFTDAYGSPPALIREGGSIPVATDFQEALDTNLLVTGFGLPGDGLHSPNERMSLDQYHRATEMVIHLMHELTTTTGAD